MTTAALGLPSAVAEAFNAVFHDRPALVRGPAHAVLTALLQRATREGETLDPAAAVAGVEAALRAREKKSETNLVHYAFATAKRETARMTEDRIEREAEERRSERLAPVGAPTVRVMGVPVPAGKMNPAWVEVIESAVKEAGLRDKHADLVRGVLAGVSFGWTTMPMEAVKGLAAGMCEKIGDPAFNPYSWAVAEIEALERQGVRCSSRVNLRKWWD